MGYPGTNDFKRKIQRNVLRGFMAQTPLDAVHPLVFTDQPELAAEVRQETSKIHGDGLETVESSFEQVHGFPTLRGMMKKAEADALEELRSRVASLVDEMDELVRKTEAMEKDGWRKRREPMQVLLWRAQQAIDEAKESKLVPENALTEARERRESVPLRARERRAERRESSAASAAPFDSCQRRECGSHCGPA